LNNPNQGNLAFGGDALAAARLGRSASFSLALRCLYSGRFADLHRIRIAGQHFGKIFLISGCTVSYNFLLISGRFADLHRIRIAGQYFGKIFLISGCTVSYNFFFISSCAVSG